MSGRPRWQSLGPLAAAAGAVREGRLAAEDAVADARDRCDKFDRLNALVQPRWKAAVEEARGIAAGDSRPLAGVPVSVKECFPVAGLQTTLGIPARLGCVDAADCDLLVRLRAAGGLCIGKANVPQAMYLHETDNPVFGRTLHPQRPDRGPGGSSGGDAALVAAGIVPLAIGNDLAGSIRQPAHACGVVGYLPAAATLGGLGGVSTMPHLQGLAPRAGFLTRRVADAAIALAAVAGDSMARFGAGCSTAITSDLTAAKDGPHGIRIAWWDGAGVVPAAAAVRRAVRTAVEGLAASGCEMIRGDDMLLEQAGWIHLGILASDGGRSIRRMLAGSPAIPPVAELLRIGGLPRWVRPPLAWAVAAAGRDIEAEAIRHTGRRDTAGLDVLLARRDRLAGGVAAWSRGEGVRAAVCPVSAVPALRHGTAGRLTLAAMPCFLANLLDLPAGSVPVGHVRAEDLAEDALAADGSTDPVLAAARHTVEDSEGLPVGVQVIALDRREETALAVMAAIEAAVG